MISTRIRGRLLVLAVAAASLSLAACSSTGTNHHDAGTDTSSDAIVDTGQADTPLDVPAADAPGVDAPGADAPGVDGSSDGLDSAQDGFDGAGDLPSEGAVDALGDGSSSDGHGSTGDAAAAGDGGTDAAPCPTCVLFATTQVVGSSSFENGNPPFNPVFNVATTFTVTIVNGSASRVPLTGVRFRYWFDPPNGGPVDAACGSCPPNAFPGIQGGTNVPGAHLFVDVIFTGGTLDAFSDTGPLPFRLTRSVAGSPLGFIGLAADYSAAPDPNQPDPHIAIYTGNGTLVWGVEP